MIHVTEAIKLCGLTDDEWIDNFALARGTAVHQAIDLEIRGTLDEASIDPEHVASRLASFRAWRAQANPTFDVTELEVRHETMGYRGRLDAVAAIDGKLYIVDWKNGSPQNWHRYQLALYAMALADMRREPTDRRACVYLHADGKPAKFVSYSDRSDFERAKAIITVAGIVKENRS